MAVKRVGKTKPRKTDAKAGVGIKEIFAIRLRTLAQDIDDWKTFKEKTGLSSADIWRHMRATGNPTTKTIAAVAQRFGMTDLEFLFLQRPEFFDAFDKVAKQIKTEDSTFDLSAAVKSARKPKSRRAQNTSPK